MSLFLRLLVRPHALWDAFVAAGMVFVLLLVGRALRPAIAALPAGTDTVEFTTGALSFLIAGAIAGVLALRLFELSVCSFAAVLPGVRRAIRAVLVAGLVLCMVAAAAIGFAIAALRSDAPGLASLAALGFGLSALASDPASRFLRRHGLLTLLGLFLASIASPEFLEISARAPEVVLVCSLSAALLCVGVTCTPSRHRIRASTTSGTLDLAYREQDMHSGAWARPIDAVRARADRFRGVRRSDLDWARAAWHEWKGNLWGGWIPTVLMQAAITFCCVLVFHWLATSADPGTGGALVRFARDTSSTNLLVGPAFFAALWITLIELGSPALFVHGVHRPLSRARRARVAWLASSAEDLLHAGSLLVLLVIAGVLLARYLTVSAGPPTGTWIGLTVATLVVMPIGRWVRLVFLDSAHGNPGPVRQGVVTGVTILALSFVASGLTVAWREAGGFGAVWPPLVGLCAVIVTRALWFTALARHHARRDLAT